MIIEKLDVVITYLKKIERNQRMLYNAIVSAQDAIMGVMTEIRNGIQKGNQINEERKEYERMTAINTNTLMWLNI